MPLLLHENLMALFFVESKLWAIEVLHCGNRDFRHFCSCDLDLDLITFIYELDPHSLEIYRMSKNKVPKSRLSKVIVWQTYIHTDRHTHRQGRNYNIIPHRFVGGQKSVTTSQSLPSNIGGHVYMLFIWLIWVQRRCHQQTCNMLLIAAVSVGRLFACSLVAVID